MLFVSTRSFAKEYDYDGHLIIIDTAEYLNSENQNDVEYEYGIFPLTECIKKGQNLFYDGFYEKYKKEAEYIVRLNPKLIYDLRWNTEYMQNQSK